MADEHDRIRGAATRMVALEHIRDAGRLVDALPAGELAQLHREINALPETDRKAIGSLLIALVTMETQRCR